jgi:hypothetical protein
LRGSGRLAGRPDPADGVQATIGLRRIAVGDTARTEMPRTLLTQSGTGRGVTMNALVRRPCSDRSDPASMNARGFKAHSQRPTVGFPVPRLRLLIILATLLTLPGYGLAGLAHVRSCQSQMSASNHVVMAGDCCPGKSDQGTGCKGSGDSPLSGKNAPCSACKAGFNCKSPQSYEPTHVVAMLVTPARPAPVVDPPTLASSHSPNGLWRPPRLI